LWSRIDPDSIDYGLLEKTKNIYVIKAEFDWNDLGSWNSIFEYASKNKENNVIRGNGVVIDGKNNFIESQNQFTAIVGQSDLVVVSTDDATLVVPRSRVEEVKRVIEFLEGSKNKKLL
jgi:mannose-1-phosphate guanylyltransferase